MPLTLTLVRAVTDSWRGGESVAAGVGVSGDVDATLGSTSITLLGCFTVRSGETPDVASNDACILQVIADWTRSHTQAEGLTEAKTIEAAYIVYVSQDPSPIQSNPSPMFRVCSSHVPLPSSQLPKLFSEKRRNSSENQRTRDPIQVTKQWLVQRLVSPI